MGNEFPSTIKFTESEVADQTHEKVVQSLMNKSSSPTLPRVQVQMDNDGTSANIFNYKWMIFFFTRLRTVEPELLTTTAFFFVTL